MAKIWKRKSRDTWTVDYSDASGDSATADHETRRAPDWVVQFLREAVTAPSVQLADELPPVPVRSIRPAEALLRDGPLRVRRAIPLALKAQWAALGESHSRCCQMTPSPPCCST